MKLFTGVPSGKAGKSFVAELACLFKLYAEGSALEMIPIKVAMAKSLQGKRQCSLH